MYTGKPGFFRMMILDSGSVSVRLRYGGSKSRTEHVLGILQDSPAPLLDLVLDAIHKLDVTDLARLRDIDKSWYLIARLFSQS